MSCPTCDHTMSSVPGGKAWWCPRCGTLKYGAEDRDVDRPLLVGRTRDLRRSPAHQRTNKVFEFLGITECLWKPESRPERGTEG